MNRRRFLQIAGGALTALSGEPAYPTRAARGGAPTGAEPSTAVTLFLGGDVMTGRGIDYILPYPSEPALHEPFIRDAGGYLELAEEVSGPIPRPVAFDYIWGDALEVLDTFKADVRIVNLETAVTVNDEPWPGKGIHYRMHPRNIPCLTAAGIDCCALANNHVLDWSHAGLAETLGSLQEAGMRIAGAGPDIAAARRPATMQLPGGGRLLVYSIAAHNSGVPPAWAAGAGQPGVNFLPNLRPGQANAVGEMVAREKGPRDIVVVSIHWGGNWGYNVTEEQRLFASLLVESGVDVIHGHSSHHAMGIEIINDRPVLHGCGDLINDYEGIRDSKDHYRGELPLMYFVTLDAATGALQRLVMKPMRIFKFRLNHASHGQVEWLRKTMDREGQRFNTRVTRTGEGLLELHWV